MVNVGFIGLGIMGAPIAENLIKAGHAVTGHDVQPAGLQRLTKAGGQQAGPSLDAITEFEPVPILEAAPE